MTAYHFTDRLDELRRAVRRRLVGYGIFAVATGGVAAFLTVIFLDWALDLPPVLRLVGGLLFLAGFGGASYFWIIKPLRAWMSLEETAWRLESHFPELRDQLVSAVEFTAHDPRGSGPLAQQSIAQAEELISQVGWRDALTLRPLVVRAIACGIAVVALVALLAAVPGWIRVGTTRYSSPWGPTQWPRSVRIVAMTRDVPVPIGESAQVSMRIEHGLTSRLRPVVHLRARSGRVETLGLQQESDGRFSTTVDSITEDLEYWFEAGDDDTSPDPGRLFTVRRPQLQSATAIVEAPPYAGAPARTVDLKKGAVEATVGSSVSFRLQLNKTLPAQNVRLQGPNDVVLTGAETHTPLVFQTPSIRVEVDQTLYPELMDEYGFTSHGSAPIQLKAMPDLAPVVSIVEPRASLEVTPSASVPIIFQITDDFGIGDAALHWTSGEGGQSAVLLDEEIRRRGEGPARYDGSHSWELAPLKLRVGGMVRYHISAVDNRRSPGIGEPQQSDSQPRELKIIAETELLSQLREDLLVVESQLRQVILHQEAIEDRTTEIVEAAAAGLTAQLPTIDSLAGRESRLIEKTQDMVGRLEAVDRRMAMNGGPEADLERLVDESVASLRDTAAAEMAEVVRSLESISALPEQDQVAALRGAQQAERQAVEQLRAVGRKLSQWGSFQGLVSRTRELLDRQTELRDETSATGRSLMGKPLSALTEEELNELKELERRQLQVVADLEQHLAQMREHQSGIAQRDPAGAEAIGAALRAERANPTTDRAKSAAKAIGENRTAAAGIDQRAAVESMRKLVAALQERQTRELEELRKQVAEAEDQVAWLIEHQKALLSATSEAGLVAADQETFASLAEQQGTLAQNTTFTADDLGESERTAAIAGMVEDAAEPMQKARGHLSEASADAASAAQQDAIELLEEALRELQNLAQAASEEWLRHSLNRIHDHLEAMLDGQRAVDHGIGELRTALQANPKLGRAQTRQATQLAREQADVRSLLSGVQEDLQTVPVYAWALDRVSKWMDLSSGKLISREIDEELAQASGRIVRELEKLVQALVDTQSMPMQEEFMEAESSAGGSSAGQASAVSVPTVAELIVLKAMQQDIAVRTAEFQRSFDAADTSEEQLRVLSHLGEDQAELRRLTELVTEKARKP